MSDKRISALTEQTGLNTGDFLAIDNAGESESKKINQSFFSGQYSDMQNVLGSKNLMPNEATTQVVSGITFTKYSDGSIKANGTASANINFVLSSSFNLPKGDYILTDGVKNQSYYVDIKNGSTVIARARDDGEFTLAADTTLLSEIWIASGQVVSNVTFYPMVRPANIPNTEFVPYAKSNKELTEDVASLNSSLPQERYSKVYSSNVAYSTILADLFSNGGLASLTKEQAFNLKLKFGINGSPGANQIYRCTQFSNDFSDFRFERVYSTAIDLIRLNSNSSNNEFNQYLFTSMGSAINRLSQTTAGTFSVWY